MSAVAGIIRNRQVILPDGCLDDFEGRNVLVTILDSQNSQSLAQTVAHDLETSADSFERYVGGWTSFNNDTLVAKIVAGMREGRTFDF